MPVAGHCRVRFGPFQLDLRSGELFKHELKLKLQGHPIQLLSMLVEKPGELITREEIRRRLWPAESGTFVDFEHGLNTAMRKLRQALGDEAETPQYIETLPRRGYRFIGEIAEKPESSASSSSSPGIGALPPEPQEPGRAVAQSAKRAPRARAVWVAGLVIVLLSTAGLLFRSARLGPHVLTVIGTQRLTFNEHVGLHPRATLEFYDSIQCDGRRVYYTLGDPHHLRYISVHGGDEKVLPSPLEFPVILHLSPDASTLLIKSTADANGSTEGDVWMLSVEGGATRRVGDIQAQDAAFAPDGKTIIFAKGQELYLTDLQGNSPVKLATVPGRAFWLRWSPDGTSLRLSVVDPKRLTYTLWELQSNGNLRQLLTNWRGRAQVCCGVWTADGEYFLFREMIQGGEKIWTLPKHGLPVLPREPALLSAGGMNLGAVVASPLGRKLFASVAAPLNKVLLHSNNGDLRQLNLGLPLERVTYSRDGQTIAAIAQGTPGEALWRVRADGSDKQQLTAPPMLVFMADISPDSQRIAFMARRPDQPWKIYWVSASGGALHEVISEVVNQADPNWSPDGQSILFGQPPFYMSEPGADRNLFVYDLRSAKTSKLPHSSGLFSPRWSPDGRYVAALSTDERSLIVLDLKTGKRQRLDLAKSLGHPFWSTHSQWVYFNSSAQVWRYRVSDGHVEPVPVNADCSFRLANGMRPDGSLLLSCYQLHRDIYALDWR